MLKYIGIGIIIVLSFLLGYYLVKVRCKNSEKSYGIKFDNVSDYAIGALICGFICARVYYVIFNLDYYIKNPLEIIQIWNGGIAIYGGIIGAVLYGLYFCRKKNINFLDLADLLIPYLALAQSIGRWGNFINQEAFGYETTLPWKMGIFDSVSNSYIYVHPTFLYESIITFAISMILLIISKKREFKGQIFYLYGILYGVGRAFVEALRTDSLMIGNIRVSMLLSALIVEIFFCIYVYSIKIHQKFIKNING